MLKYKIVQFINGIARIHMTSDLSEFKDKKDTYIDPDLSHVKGISPSYWGVKDNIIIPLNTKAYTIRKQELHKSAAKKSVQLKSKFNTSFKWIIFLILTQWMTLAALIHIVMKTIT